MSRSLIIIVHLFSTGTIVTPGEPAYSKEDHKKESELLEKMNEEASVEPKKEGDNK